MEHLIESWSVRAFSGGHVSISGVSGIATKTSFALFLLHSIIRCDGSMTLLPSVRGG